MKIAERSQPAFYARRLSVAILLPSWNDTLGDVLTKAETYEKTERS